MAKDMASYFLEQGEPLLPKPKPKNYTKTLDLLNSEAAVNTLSPKTYTNLVGQFSRKAYDNKEISATDYYDIVMPLFGETGEMVTRKIEEYEDMDNYAKGGRVNYKEGSDYFDEQKTMTKQKTKTGPIKGGKTPQIPTEDFEKYQKLKKEKKLMTYAAEGGRIGYNEGTDPEITKLKEKIIKLMDEENLTFEEAYREAREDD